MNTLAALNERIGILVWQYTPHCSEITRLASRSFEQPLSIHTRWKIQLHCLICAWCQRYVKQLKFLNRASSCAIHQAELLPGGGLSTAARQRIVLRLKSAENENL
ncbi:MAG: hypothetical protein WCS94_23715 [Verrucomicrobiota bacterium]